MSQTAKGLLLSLQTQTKKSAVELQVATGKKYSIPQSENNSLQTESEISQYNKKESLDRWLPVFFLQILMISGYFHFQFYH